MGSANKLSVKDLVLVIKLHNDHKVYYAGEKLSGEIDLPTVEPDVIQKIVLHFTGFSRVKWITKSDKLGKKIVHVNQSEVLEARNFCFPVPVNIPSSFEGKYGFVRYKIKAKVYFTVSNENLTAKRYIPVMSVLNLNDISWVKNKFSLEVGKRLGFFKCKQGPLIASVRCENSGFVPGQVVAFDIHIENYTKRFISNLFLEIIRMEEFKSNDPFVGTRKIVHVCKKVDFGDVGDVDERNIRSLIQIPLLTPTGMRTSKLIDTQYFIALVVKFYGCHSDLNFIKDIVIGTVPLLSSRMSENCAEMRVLPKN